jgi:DNA helicase-2/ATP-dependent DNA helicase PcrA
VKLSDSQQAAVDSRAPVLQILACAGSGKTEVLARRVVRLVTDGEDPASIVAFTFTDKAAAEMKARIERRAAEADPSFADVPPTARGLFVGTIHSYCLQLLQTLGPYQAYDALTEERHWALLLRVARRLGIVDLFARLSSAGKIASAPAVTTFVQSLEVVYNERIDRQTLRERAPEFARVLEHYERLLDSMKLIPFHLMIDHACDLLGPEGQLRESLQGQIRHVLVDEYQDLNPAQEEILRAFVGMGATLTVVGDDDQAIYQWRGGDVELCLRFSDRYGGDQITLGENRRSKMRIVGLSRVVAEQLPERLSKDIRAGRPDEDDCVEFVRVEGGTSDEAEMIARRIQQLVARGHRHGDIAVLCRSVRTSAPPVVETFRERGIPHHVVGRLSILTRPEMALVARIFVLWAGGSWYPGDGRVAEVVTQERLAADIAELTGRSPKEAGRIVTELERMGREARSDGVWDIITVYNQILRLLNFPDNEEAQRRDMGLGRMSEILADFDHAARRAIPQAALDQLTPAGAEEATEDAVVDPEGPSGGAPTPSPGGVSGTPGEIYLARLRSFLEEYCSRAAEEQPEGPVEAIDAVHIMTVHQAKGLEFPVVFVPAVIEGRFPSSLTGKPQSWYVPGDMFDGDRYEGREEDEKRLFYVALTRARELLLLSYFTQHRTSRASPSRFLRDLSSAMSLMVPFGGASPCPATRANGDEASIELDFSSLSAYIECEFKYWLRERCGFQPPLARELGFGKFLHYAIAELARRAGNARVPTLNDLKDVMQDFYLPFAGPIPFQKLRASAQRRLETYLSRYGDELTRTLQSEVPFEVPIQEARLLGRMDLVLLAPDGSQQDVVLVDFKTSEGRPPSELHQNQLRLYAEACRALGLNPVQLIIHDLDSDMGGRVPVDQDEEQTKSFRKQLGGWVSGIRAGRFRPSESPAACQDCDFHTFCRHSGEEH